MSDDRSTAAFERARQVIAGGVNSPVRAFRAVGGTPIFMRSGSGAYMTDVDGNRRIDYVLSWGPLILGHAHPDVVAAVCDAASRGSSFGTPTEAETELAQLVCELVPSVERVRFTSSGTEATMSAVRLARAYTGRTTIVKFAGCYHGHADAFLIAAGSGALTHGVPNSPGVTPGAAADTLVLPFNDLPAVEAAFAARPDAITAVIVEPYAGNIGLVLPRDGFLAGLRQLCDRYGALLIFDEVMTGFRVARGGAQERENVRPDLTTLGKVIGGGLPVGAFGGRRDIMQLLSPDGPVYQAGTLSGNPLAMAAGIATLRIVRADGGLYERAAALGRTLVDGIREAFAAKGIPTSVSVAGTMFGIFFTQGPVYDVDAAMTSDTALYARYFHAMLDRGVYLAPSQFEAAFLSNAHGWAEIDRTLEAARSAAERATEPATA